MLARLKTKMPRVDLRGVLQGRYFPMQGMLYKCFGKCENDLGHLPKDLQRLQVTLNNATRTALGVKKKDRTQLSTLREF